MEQPLVSIIVITYNSAKFVIETLQSAKDQTYRNIELIISDDGSKDKTIEICNEWILKNQDRFFRIEFLTVPFNTGIPANCNRGVKAAKGEWVKIIAGDDILHQKCIESNINYILKNNLNRIIVVSNMIRFNDGEDYHKDGVIIVPDNLFLLKKCVNSEIQHRYVTKYYLGNTPTLFIPKEILDKVPFDESLPFQEDRPFAINATKKGYCFRYLDAATVYYRISESSVFASKSSKVLFNDFYKKRRQFVLKYIYPNMSRTERFVTDMEYYRKGIIDILGLNKNNWICRMIYSATTRLFPYRIYKKIQRKKESNEEFWLSSNRSTSN
jgi:glycosyltransferase involved in cell wall biosynthesis